MNRLKISLIVMLQIMFYGVQAQKHWTVNAHDYQYDMTIYAALYNDEGKVVSACENIEIAAFNGTTCCGSALADSVLVQGKNKVYYYLRVYGNNAQGDTLTFKCYNKVLNEEKNIVGVACFISESRLGYPSSPYVLVDGSRLSLTACEHGGLKMEGFVTESLIKEAFVGADNKATVNYLLFPDVCVVDTALTAEKTADGLNPNCLMYFPDEAEIDGRNVVREGASQKVVLRDGHPYYCPTKIEADEANYIRSISVTGSYASMYLPFTVDSLPESVIWMETFHSYDAASHVVTFELKDTIEANTPFIVHMSGSGETVFMNRHVEVMNTDNAPTAPTVTALVGTFTDMRGTDPVGNVCHYFALKADGSGFGYMSSKTTIKAFRSYLYLSDGLNISSSGTQVLRLRHGDEDPPVAVSPLLNGDEPALVNVYSLDGTLLRRGVRQQETLLGLPKGVFIVNGKKVKLR